MSDNFRRLSQDDSIGENNNELIIMENKLMYQQLVEYKI